MNQAQIHASTLRRPHSSTRALGSTMPESPQLMGAEQIGQLPLHRLQEKKRALFGSSEHELGGDLHDARVAAERLIPPPEDRIAWDEHIGRA